MAKPKASKQAPKPKVSNSREKQEKAKERRAEAAEDKKVKKQKDTEVPMEVVTSETPANAFVSEVPKGSSVPDSLGKKKKKGLFRFDKDRLKAKKLREKELALEVKKKAKVEDQGDSTDEEEEYTNKRIFIGNLPHDIKAKELREVCERFGKVHKSRLLVNLKGVFRGSAFASFEEEASVVQALSMSGMEYKDHILKVSRATPPTPKEQLEVWVGGLGTYWLEKRIRKMFAPCGDIAKLTMHKNQRSGKFNGVAIIKFTTETAANNAVKLFKGKTVDERALTIKLAKPKKHNRTSAKEPTKEERKAKKEASAKKNGAKEGAKEEETAKKGAKRKAGAAEEKLAAEAKSAPAEKKKKAA